METVDAFCSLTESQMLYCRNKLFVEPRVSEKPSAPHPHGCLALERRICEKKILARAVEIRAEGHIVDIGSNIARIRQRGYGPELVHGCCPILLPADHFRAMKASEAGITGWCNHRVENCDCVVPAVYISVHSIYYFTPHELARLINKSSSGELLAAYHTFENYAGSFGPDEAEYYHDDQGVVMRVKGNPTPYTHPAPDWLLGTEFCQLDEETALVWNVLEHVGSTIIGRFNVVKNNFGPKISYEFNKDCIDVDTKNTYMALPTMIGFKPINVPFESHHIKYDRILSIRDTVFVYGTTIKRVVIPKGVIQLVAVKLMGQPRTPETWRSAIYHARTALKNVNIPPHVYHNAVLHGASLGFTLAVGSEGTILHTIWHRYANVFAMHNSALSASSDYFDVRYFLILFFVPAYARYRFSSQTGALPYRYTLLLLSILLIGVRKFAFLSDNWSVTYAIEKVATYVRGVLSPRYNKFKGTDGNKTIPPQNPVNVIQVDDDPHVGKNPGQQDRVILSGIAFDTNLPIVGEPNQENELHGIKCRMTMEKPIKDNHCLELYREAFHKFEPFKRLRQNHINLTDKDYDKWNNRFPGAVKKQHDEARDKSTTEAYRVAVSVRRKSFIKMEKLNKVTLDGVSEFANRIIQGATAEANVLVGPWVYKFTQKSVLKEWGADERTLLASSINCETLGAWFDRAKARYGDNAVGFVIDFKHYDGTCDRDITGPEIQLYRDVGMPPHIAEILEQNQVVKGTTRHGINYEIPEGMRCSGDPQTLVGNSIDNVAATSAAFADSGAIIEEDYDLTVCGDDDLGIGDVRKILPAILRAEENLRGMGLIPTISLCHNVEEMEFCSKIPWPTTEGTVFGPKLGKCLTKAGFVLNKSGEANMAATCRAMINDVNHIPFLREYFLRVNQLLTDKTPRGKTGPRWHTSRMFMSNERTWDFLQRRYGLTREDHEVFCNKLLEVRELPAVIHWEPFERICEIDELEPKLEANILNDIGAVFCYPVALDKEWWTVSYLNYFRSSLLAPYKREISLHGDFLIGNEAVFQAIHNTLLHAVVVAPLIEEAIKKSTKHRLLVTILFICYEAWTRSFHPRYFKGPALMHLAVSNLPYKYAVLVHACWNYNAVINFFAEHFPQGIIQ